MQRGLSIVDLWSLLIINAVDPHTKKSRSNALATDARQFFLLLNVEI